MLFSADCDFYPRGHYRFSFYSMTPVVLLLAAALVVITFIDLDYQTIPDVISITGIPIGFLCSFLIPWGSLQASLLGTLFGVPLMLLKKGRQQAGEPFRPLSCFRGIDPYLLC